MKEKNVKFTCINTLFETKIKFQLLTIKKFIYVAVKTLTLLSLFQQTFPTLPTWNLWLCVWVKFEVSQTFTSSPQEVMYVSEKALLMKLVVNITTMKEKYEVSKVKRAIKVLNKKLLLLSKQKKFFFFILHFWWYSLLA